MLSTSLRILCALGALCFLIGCGSGSEGANEAAPAASSGEEAAGDGAAEADPVDGEEAADEEAGTVDEASGSSAARDAKMKILKARKAAGDDQAAGDDE